MITKSISRLVITIVLGWVFTVSSVNAALIFNKPADPHPDAFGHNAIHYVYTNGIDNSAGFDMTITGAVESVTTSSNIAPITGACDYGMGCYNLTAHFDSSGNYDASATGASTFSISYTGTIDAFGDGSLILSSGDLVTGTLNNFGFASASPHDGTSGLFQWTFDIISGDYLTDFGGVNGGTELNISDLLFSLTSGTWDNVNGSGMNLMQFEFDSSDWGCGIHCVKLAGGTQSNTFIPVPAAVWLFGSGLLALAGVARRRRVH